MQDDSKTTKCTTCGAIITYRNKRGPIPKACPKCKRQKQSDYYASWYARNGYTRNRAGGYSVRIMEWRKQNPEKVAAHRLVSAALKGGRIKNPGKCSSCGKMTSYLDAHHDDYSKPLAIRWLCIRCHRKIHA